MKRARRAAVLILPALLLGCSPDDATGPGPGPAFSQGGTVPDIDGPWSFTRVARLSLPAFVAEQVFGLVPEGPITRLRCAQGGSLVVTQDGPTFSGVASVDGTTCETSGGQVRQSPGRQVAITDGRLNGTSLRFDWLGNVLCTTHGVVSQDGDRQMGAGPCIVPGHPRSPAPLEPPPAGTENTLEWLAWR